MCELTRTIKERGVEVDNYKVDERNQVHFLNALPTISICTFTFS